MWRFLHVHEYGYTYEYGYVTISGTSTHLTPLHQGPTVAIGASKRGCQKGMSLLRVVIGFESLGNGILCIFDAGDSMLCHVQAVPLITKNSYGVGINIPTDDASDSDQSQVRRKTAT